MKKSFVTLMLLAFAATPLVIRAEDSAAGGASQTNSATNATQNSQTGAGTSAGQTASSGKTDKGGKKLAHKPGKKKHSMEKKQGSQQTTSQSAQ